MPPPPGPPAPPSGAPPAPRRRHYLARCSASPHRRCRATLDSEAGRDVVEDIGCSGCHVPSITTAPAGTVINGGTFTVPEALGNKVIHPFSDFLLHELDTGDGIVQGGPPDTANKLRTP